MESETEKTAQLRLQFQALQEQQMQRLRKTQQKQKENVSDAARCINAEGDMNLSLTNTDMEEKFGSRLLQQENQDLQARVRELKDENGRLFKLLKEKEFEMQHLKRKRDEDRMALAGTGGVAGEAAATKIVELSKKVRELAVEIEREKTKTKTFRNTVKELQQELQDTRSICPTLKKDQQLNKRSSQEVTSALFKSLKKKLSAAELKVAEYRNQTQLIEQELKIARKVLTNEVGESVNLHHLLNNPGSWRGRAQQILVLQNEVRDLKMQLNVASSRRGDLDMEEDYTSESGIHINNEDKNLSYIRTIEKERKEALEKLKEDNKLLMNEHEETKKKLKANKARNDILTSELKDMKKHVLELLEKDKHDNELMDALLKKKAELEEMLNQLRQEEAWHQRDNRKINQQHQNEEKRLNSNIKQLKQMVSEREREIELLTLEQQTEVKRLNCMVSERDAKIQALEGVIEEIKYKNSEEDSCCSACVAKLAALEARCNEYMTVYKTASVERDKLQELGLLQQKEIEELKQKCEEMEQKLHKERLNCTLLEKELGKSRLELESARPLGQVRGTVAGAYRGSQSAK